MTVMWDVEERNWRGLREGLHPSGAEGQVLLGGLPAKARSGPARRRPAAGRQTEARQGRPLPGDHGPGARRDHGHAPRGRDEILSFRR